MQPQADKGDVYGSTAPGVGSCETFSCRVYNSLGDDGVMFTVLSVQSPIQEWFPISVELAKDLLELAKRAELRNDRVKKGNP